MRKIILFRRPSGKPSDIGEKELIALTAFMISLVALSIDMMLPALPQIGADLGIVDNNSRQAILVVFFAGLTAAQILYGPLADRFGRKPAVALGTSIFLVGSLVSVVANDFEMMLAGRFLQGVGAAAMRTLSVTIVRDQYQGRAMARVMSVAMSVFIIVPCIAPLMGQLVISLFHWRVIFVVLCVSSMVLFAWFWLRQKETLVNENRVPFNIVSLFESIKEICTTPVAIGYTVAAGLVSGAFNGYLFSAQQIFHDVFDQGDSFALYFAVLAIALGVAGLINARLVTRFGMRPICYIAASGIAAVSIYLVISLMSSNGSITFPTFMLTMITIFFCIGFLFGNMNAVAMQPLGHIAGIASSVVSLISGAIALCIGFAIGKAFDNTIIPLALGFLIAALMCVVVMKWADRSAGYQSENEIPAAVHSDVLSNEAVNNNYLVRKAG